METLQLSPQPAQPLWLQLLTAAISADPRGKAGVAERMDISRPYVCRVLSGSIPVPSPRFIDRVLKTYQRLDCPHLGTSLAHSECQAHASRSYAALSHMEVDHWRACQRCQHRPAGAAQQTAAACAPAPLVFMPMPAPLPAQLPALPQPQGDAA
jgi:hypothetical protein